MTITRQVRAGILKSLQEKNKRGILDLGACLDDQVPHDSPVLGQRNELVVAALPALARHALQLPDFQPLADLKSLHVRSGETSS
jgi:hypothetical protein